MLRGDDGWGGVRHDDASSSAQELQERLRYHREAARVGSSARRRVGAPTPTDAEIQAVYAAREAAATRLREEALHGDRHRRGVVSVRYYDALMAAGTDAAGLQEAPPQSDVEARRDVVRPVRKLVAVLATRQRLARLLRTVAGSTSMEAVRSEGPAMNSISSPTAMPLPAALPAVSTLLRSIALPDVAALRSLAGGGEADASCDLVEVPRHRPCHEPFAFRLHHFTPVRTPDFVLDVSPQADKEVRRGDGDGASGRDGEDVPVLAPPVTGVTDVGGSRFTSRSASVRAVKAAPVSSRAPVGAAPAAG
ncbi:hypothetical protein NESM_000174600 [Novymonas esmeraldas]|uniref:Uncharacterized protein n=1 Tax=Novymonas esmeraldas TaxID=1808958 RepID=A0AAW0F3H7_9TRYP